MDNTPKFPDLQKYLQNPLRVPIVLTHCHTMTLSAVTMCLHRIYALKICMFIHRYRTYVRRFYIYGSSVYVLIPVNGLVVLHNISTPLLQFGEVEGEAQSDEPHRVPLASAESSSARAVAVHRCRRRMDKETSSPTTLLMEKREG